MKRRRLTGTVVSDAPDQTITVKVDRRKVHPLYRKAYSVSKKFAAHDPENAHTVGDVVTIEETRPISKTKRFQVIGEGDTSVTPPAKSPSKPAAKAKSVDEKAKAPATPAKATPKEDKS